MRYKMLVLDLDDTLLNDSYEISERNKQLLLKAQENGVYVVLASGRPTQAMIRYAEELQLAHFGSFIISFNGAVITDIRKNEHIYERSLTVEEIHSLHDFSVSNNVHIITYLNQQIVSETHSEYIDIEKQLTGMSHNKVSCFKSAVNTPAVKCLMLEHPDYLKTVETKLQTLRPDMMVCRSKPFFLEIMPQGVDKAASVHLLAQKLGIKQDEIIAVGNAGNDLSMIEYAGLGVWVDNVSDELRHKADVVVSSNNDHGVAEVVERFLLQ